MASSTLAPAHAILAVQRTVRALDRVTQNLDVFRAELEERAQPVPLARACMRAPEFRVSWDGS